MNSRLWLIVLAVAGAVHNGLRVIASILGMEWGYFNCLPFRPTKPLTMTASIEILGVFAIVGVVFVIAASLWRRAQAASSVWSSATWAVAAGALVGLMAT